MQQTPIFDRYKWIILSLVGLVVLAALIFLLLQKDEPVTITIVPPPPTATHTPTGSPAPIEVYVTGEVAKPASLVNLPAGSRVDDAIAAAGGASPNADLNAVNLAQILQDGDQVFVPAFNQTVLNTPTPNAPRIVNLNTATLEELESLPDIGEVTAQKIIDYREANGGFKSVDELDNVEGVGAATIENLRGLVTVD